MKADMQPQQRQHWVADLCDGIYEWLIYPTFHIVRRRSLGLVAMQCVHGEGVRVIHEVVEHDDGENNLFDGERKAIWCC